MYLIFYDIFYFNRICADSLKDRTQKSAHMRIAGCPKPFLPRQQRVSLYARIFLSLTEQPLFSNFAVFSLL